MRKAFISLSTIIIGGIIAIGAFGGYLYNINHQYLDDLRIEQELAFGAINFVRAEPTTLSSSISASASSIVLADFTTPDGTELSMTDFGEVGYATIEPGRSNIEFISFTGISQDGSSTKATLTGVTRGLKFVSPYTTDATLKKAHAGGLKVIVSNPPQLYNQSTFKLNDETITGIWTFTNTAYPRINSTSTPATDDREFITKFQHDADVIAGGVPLTESVPGIGIGATPAELAAGTATSTHSAVDYKNLAMAEDFGATSTARTMVPVTEADGDLNADFIGQDQDYTWSGTTTLSTTTISGVLSVSGDATFSGTTSLATTTYNGIDLGDQITHFGGDGSDGALSTATTTVTINSAGAKIVVKNYTSIDIPVGGVLNFSNSSATGTAIFLKVSGDCTIAGTIQDVANGGSPGAGGNNAPGVSGTDGDIFIIKSDGGTGGSYQSTAGGGTTVSSLVTPASYAQSDSIELLRYTDIFVGGGAAGGGAASVSTGGDGGTSAGALILECAGALNFTGAINVFGADGLAATGANADGGGGGAGGYVRIVYNTLTANTGSTTVAGGTGGAKTGGGTAGGNGENGYIFINKNLSY